MRFQYEKIFSQLPIIYISADKQATKTFAVVNHSGKEIGKFKFHNDGFISDLYISKKIRRKKLGLDALLSIKKFVIEECKRKHLDFFRFRVDKKAKNNLLRLYKHAGADCTNCDARYNEFRYIINKADREQLLRQFEIREILSFF